MWVPAGESMWRCCNSTTLFAVGVVAATSSFSDATRSVYCLTTTIYVAQGCDCVSLRPLQALWHARCTVQVHENRLFCPNPQ